VLELGTSVGFTVPTTSFRASLGWSTSRRRSSVEGLTVKRGLHTVTTSVGPSM